MFRSAKWQSIRVRLQRHFKRWRVHVRPEDLQAIRGLRVCVVGNYLEGRHHLADHLCAAYAQSKVLHVEQHWAAIGEISSDPALRAATRIVVKTNDSKFGLLNRLIAEIDLSAFDYLLVTDDDVFVPEGFMDAYISAQHRLNFALAQPARAIHSFYDHRITLRRPWLLARQTRFVEIGPVFSIDLKQASDLVPFDRRFPMGWGMDLWWPCVMGDRTMGIIDAVSADHSYRPQGAAYSRAGQLAGMKALLTELKALTQDQAQVVLRSFIRRR